MRSVKKKVVGNHWSRYIDWQGASLLRLSPRHLCVYSTSFTLHVTSVFSSTTSATHMNHSTFTETLARNSSPHHCFLISVRGLFVSSIMPRLCLLYFVSARTYISAGALFISCRKQQVCSFEDAFLILTPPELPPFTTTHPTEHIDCPPQDEGPGRNRVHESDKWTKRVREEQRELEKKQNKLLTSFSSWFCV